MKWDHFQVLKSGNSAVLFDAFSGKISVLNQVGLVMIENLRSGVPTEVVIQKLSDLYGITPEVADRDLRDLLSQLRRNRMLRGDEHV